jgi:hypothetical protein
MGGHVVKRAKDLDLVLHIGLHKTASSYIQNMLSTRRYDLLRAGVLYPLTGLFDTTMANTRDGAQSGHAMFTRTGNIYKRLQQELLTEAPSNCSTVLLSSENFTIWHRPMTAEQQLEKFNDFRSVKVVLVLRRQDTWIESYYKQIIDGHRDYQTLSFDEFLATEGPKLLDYHQRFTPWREVVGADNFHVMSYDDVADADELCRSLVEIAGVDPSVLGDTSHVADLRYDSVRAIDTVGLRILNGYRFDSRELRTSVAKAIYDAAPAGDIPLLTPEARAAIIEHCAPVNERIEAEWFDRPVPGLRFGKQLADKQVAHPGGPELVEYVGRVIALCEEARPRDTVPLPDTESLLDEQA